MKTLLIAGAMLALPMTATAQERSDRFAHSAIERGDYAAAERQLKREARVSADRPEVLLNLAAVYAMTQRPDEARALYERVLSIDEVRMAQSADRVAGSHRIAEVGLAQLGR
ncbi:tetratricopeptide repeat protein [Sphingomonas sp. AX6]|uniref:tetratricopeptide repeat protein n=1 Tax=Sphingomonas sp. AX6 TaxID=2653171 RepID=UPI0012F329E2|nr:tetratricopeptide repeat protein [Sphingomonas sp. AX6]VXC65681.1 Cellulose synthase operon protein C [Sphingomonas sp. AX6]